MLPRRIAYVLKIFPKISETFIVSELAELRRRGVELRILSLQPPRSGLRHDMVAREGLDQITCYEPGDFSKIIREFRPQLLHAHFATEATEAAIELATDHRIPFTFTAHGYDVHRKAPPDFGRRAAAARAVVTVSQANADFIARTFAVGPSHIRVIPCGVDTELFRPHAAWSAPVTGRSNVEISSRHGNTEALARPVVAAPGDEHAPSSKTELLPQDPPIIVCVARHVEVKNLGLLLQSCALLRARGVQFRCALIGDGPCRGELEERRARLGLAELVEMPGPAEQKEVLAWWQRAAVAALTSNSEGMPVSLMEAAACGVPAVATAVGGVPELIEDGVTGLLVPAGDATGMAAALEQVITDRELRARMSLAARRRAEEKFSVARQVEQLLALWSEILSTGGATPIFVRDPFDAASDSSMPTLTLALNPTEAKKELKRHLPRVSGEDGKLRLKAIRVIRHKPGKRCVVEYDLRVERPGLAPESVTVIGKTRAKRFGKEGYRTLDRLWQAGFDSASADGVSVPEPLGVIPRFQMWFQRKVPGQTATRLLGGPDGVGLARRIAEASHKLHQANIPTERRHAMNDELRILHECLGKVAALHSQWGPRLERVLAACDQLGASLPEPRPCGIHRDFYPAQVIVETGQNPRVYLIDFDLYCLGDPGLDIGNFIGHMMEQSLRESGNAGRCAEQARALRERFIELSGESCRAAIDAYTTLTLVRHIYLSTQFPQRQMFAPALLELCEQRLGLVLDGN
jgi:glycosyltransferase involved in cell wall biosynthesis